jgi:hypothetical protein
MKLQPLSVESRLRPGIYGVIHALVDAACVAAVVRASRGSYVGDLGALTPCWQKDLEVSIRIRQELRTGVTAITFARPDEPGRRQRASRTCRFPFSRCNLTGSLRLTSA